MFYKMQLLTYNFLPSILTYVNIFIFNFFLLLYATVQKFGVGTFFFLLMLKEISYAH